ncbi:M48 family metallopeptidase [Cellvibrio fontiphilus]|uniref:M48 family metallopeptidase n=1 Tax=Cellvibrio fontiphilus TaxID=1815559 RepID=A0ABV7FB74_9GAMM
MNFFEHQDRARRKTKQLIALLALAVLALVSITTFAAAALVYFSGNASPWIYEQPHSTWNGVLHAFSVQTFFWIALAVTSVVFLGSFFRFMQLGSGGRAIAEAMGGRLLLGTSQDQDERKILNVVEEMAIASGTPVPPVYLLEDDAINAFAAGYRAQDAVIGITRGCIQQLSRDELQGVVAHEFSHIFHGDMRLNMRLVALLYGILVIGLIGDFLLRANRRTSLVSSSRNKSSGGFIVLIGLGLLIIGYTGTFFGNLIKAAVSRQREFLADASAVQFTRNPEGIAGALKKIGASTAGSRLHNDNAAEFSHMYFSQGVKHLLAFMATHPPLGERIKRILPRWDGKFESTHAANNDSDQTNKGSKTFTDSDSSPIASIYSNEFHNDQTTLHPSIDNNLAQIAQPTHEQLAYAQDCLTHITPALKKACQEPFSARGVVFGLLLDQLPQTRTDQLSALTEQFDADELGSLLPIINISAAAEVHLRLPLVELSIAALKQLSAAQQQNFLSGLNRLIQADEKVSLMEWAIHRIVLHNICPAPLPLSKYSLQQMHEECQLLISLMAYTGATNQANAEMAFALASRVLPFKQFTLLARSAIKLDAVDAALTRLNQLQPLQKPQLLKAMNLCVMQDGKLHIAEAELLRALADGIDCPIPPQLQALPIQSR